MLSSTAAAIGTSRDAAKKRAKKTNRTAITVVATGRPLAELLAENKEITKHMSRDELAKLCDPANYLGQAGEMVDRVLAMRGR